MLSDSGIPSAVICCLLFVLAGINVEADSQFPTLVPFGIPAELSEGLLDTFERDEKARATVLLNKYNVPIDKLEASYTLEGREFARYQNLSFRVSTTPFVTSAGFRDLCFPHVLDNRAMLDTCALPTDAVAFFKRVKDGACIYMTAVCYFTIMEMNLLQHVPGRFSVVTHYSDRAVPDMDPKQKAFGVVQTSPALQKLYDSGHLLSLHAMNMHYTGWHTPEVMKPPWLHCIPIGMPLRFYQPHSALLNIVESIRRNVIARPRSFWTDSHRPLLLVPIVAKRYARDRAKAIRELGANVKRNTLKMTLKTFPQQSEFFNAISLYRFTLCPWGNGLDTHRLYEVLAHGGIPVLKRSSINPCFDSSDNNITVTVVSPHEGTSRNDSVHRGNIPVVIVNKWTDVTTALLEGYWARFVGHSFDNVTKTTTPGPDLTPRWDYSHLTMAHWAARIMGVNYDKRTTPPEQLTYLP